MPLTQEQQKFLEIVHKNDTKEAEKFIKDNNLEVNCIDEKTGSTPLHIAVGNNNLSMVKLLIEKGAKTFITDMKFKSPFQYSVEEMERKSSSKNFDPNIFFCLLRNNTYLKQDDIKEMLAFCQEFYLGQNTEADNELLDYCVSRLTGVDVCELLYGKHTGRGSVSRPGVSNRDVYLAHLQSHNTSKQVDRTLFSLGNWWWEEFLPLRVRYLFELLVKAERDGSELKSLPLLEGKPVVKSGWKSISEALLHEIQTTLNTLYIHSGVLAVSKLHNIEQKIRGRLSVAYNIARSLKELENNCELSFAGGWQEHAVYICFMKKNNKIIIRIDNVGYGFNSVYWLWNNNLGGCLSVSMQVIQSDYNITQARTWVRKDFQKKNFFTPSSTWENFHFQPTNKDYFKPENRRYSCILGVLPLEAYDLSGSSWPYLEGLIAAYESRDLPEAMRYIYNLEGLFVPEYIPSPQELLLAPAKIQKAENCVVKNHQIGLQYRLTPWIAPEEKETKDFNLLNLHRHKLYRWLRDREIELVGSKIKPEKPRDYKKYWDLSFKPRSFPLCIKNMYIAHCHSLTKVHLLIDRKEIPLENIHVPLKLVQVEIKQQETKEKKEEKRHQKVGASLEIEHIFKNSKGRNQVVVTGQAGIGKSNICLHIIQERIKNKLWMEQFDWIFRIPLKNLNAAKYKLNKKYTLLEIVIQECFPKDKFQAWMTPFLKQAIDNDTKILWLLDGRDELPLSASSHLDNIWKTLLKRKNLIITTRPHIVKDISHFSRFEIMGFLPEDINTYVKKFFSFFHQSSLLLTEKSTSKEEKKYSESENDKSSIILEAKLLDFLEKNISIRNITRFPINLELICSIWQDPSNILQSMNSLTLTELYQQMILWLSRRFLLFKENLKSEKIQDGYYVFRRLFKEDEALEIISFESVFENLFEISYKFLNKKVPEITHDKFFLQDILSLGILNSKNDPAATSYEFAHRTFQEFFAAKYIVKCLKLPENDIRYKKVITFIQENKYKTNSIIYNFISELLSPDKIKDNSWIIFWDVLLNQPYDLTGINHVGLIMSCLQQANCHPSIIARYPNIMKNIAEFLLAAIKSKLVESKVKAFLINNPLVVAHPHLCPIILEALVTSEEGNYHYFLKAKNTTEALILYSDQNCKKIFINQLKPLLRKYINNTRIASYISTALRSIESFRDRWINLAKYNEDINTRAHAVFLLGFMRNDDVKVIDYLISLLLNFKELKEIRQRALFALNELHNYDDKVMQAIWKVSEKDLDKNMKSDAEEVYDELESHKGYVESLSIHDFEGPEDDESEQSFEDRLVRAYEIHTIASSIKLNRLFDNEQKSENITMDKSLIKNYVEIKSRGKVILVEEDFYEDFCLRERDRTDIDLTELSIISDGELHKLWDKKIYFSQTPISKLVEIYVTKPSTLWAKFIAKRALINAVTLFFINKHIVIEENETYDVPYINCSNIENIEKNLIMAFSDLTKEYKLQNEFILNYEATSKALLSLDKAKSKEEKGILVLTNKTETPKKEGEGRKSDESDGESKFNPRKIKSLSSPLSGLGLASMDTSDDDYKAAMNKQPGTLATLKRKEPSAEDKVGDLNESAAKRQRLGENKGEIKSEFKIQSALTMFAFDNKGLSATSLIRNDSAEIKHFLGKEGGKDRRNLLEFESWYSDRAITDIVFSTQSTSVLRCVFLPYASEEEVEEVTEEATSAQERKKSNSSSAAMETKKSSDGSKKEKNEDEEAWDEDYQGNSDWGLNNPEVNAVDSSAAVYSSTKKEKVIHENSFEKQFESLNILKVHLKATHACFVSFSPDKMGSNRHFIFGLYIDHDLLIIDPMGMVPRDFFLEKVSKVMKRHKINKLIISKTKIQNDPKADVSCGPICTELLLHLSVLDKNTITAILATTSTVRKEKTFSEDNKLEYHEIELSSTDLLPNTLIKSLNTKDKPYAEAMSALRQSHYKRLQNSKGLDSDKYEQYVFSHLVQDKINILKLSNDTRYQELKKRFSGASMKQKPASSPSAQLFARSNGVISMDESEDFSPQGLGL